MNAQEIEEYLQHYGILGMKWGVRRSKRQISADHATVSALKKKKISELSDAELKKVATRLQLEKQYKQLNPSTIAKGRNAVSGLVKGPLKGVTNTIIQTAIKEYGKAIVTYGIEYAKSRG